MTSAYNQSSAADNMSNYAEMACMSNFSFLRGASHPEELVVNAKKAGLYGLAITDRNTLSGVVRAHMAAKEAGIAFQPGCRLVFIDETPDCLVWPINLNGWNNLCRLLTTGNLRAPKGECHLKLEDLLTGAKNLMIAVSPAQKRASNPTNRDWNLLENTLIRLNKNYPHHIWLAIHHDYNTMSAQFLSNWETIAKRTTTPLLATNHVLYHRPERRMLQDVVTCIREHVRLEDAGFLLKANGERYIKTGQQMSDLYSPWAWGREAIAASKTLFDSLEFNLDELRYQYPDEKPSSGLNPQDELARLAKIGARKRYPKKVPAKIEKQISHELSLIKQLAYAPYFLTVYDIVRFARSEGILCQGRGSAANSTICYCIGITDVDPALTDLLFERFISPERREPPDIDVDFEHERREEVIQYIYARYGRERAGLAASVVTYRARSAVREIGKVFGLSEDAISALAGSVWGHSSSELGEREAVEAGLDIKDQTLSRVMALAHEINGFPRHLSQHVGGFVITRDRLDHIIPVMNTAMRDRTQVEWDKDDLEALGILKIDILALGMLTCLRKAFDLLEHHYDMPMTLASMPKEDERTYAMIQRADTVGVFQIESRAQMSMLPRLKPKTFYDLVIEVAIVRPGPIQGDMVHPYLRRRQGKEEVIYPSKELESVLGRTLGIPLFQEQAMKIAIVAAGFSPGEADKLRRAMATFRRVGTIHTFQEKMIEGMAAKGYDREFAARCFRQIEGFGEYGFPESHAASFALLVYASCWLKCHYPDVFAAAILNSQPMGFYSPSQLVRDAREHGVEILPPDINCSDHDSTLVSSTSNPGVQLHRRNRDMRGDIKSKYGLRLGLRQIKGVGTRETDAVMENRTKPGYTTIRDFWRRSGLGRSLIERFADADAFRSIGLDRRRALWGVRALDPETGPMPLFDYNDKSDPQQEVPTRLPVMPVGEHVIQDYRYLSLSLKAHPISFLREGFTRQGLTPHEAMETTSNGKWITIAGLIVVRQRPGSAKGVLFMTLEDETGIANVIVWPKVFEKYRAVVMASRFVKVRGKLQKADNVIHLIADYIEDMSPHLAALSEEVQHAAIDQMGGLAHADEAKRPVLEMNASTKPRSRLARLLKDVPDLKKDYQKLARSTGKVMPKGRNFH